MCTFHPCLRGPAPVAKFLSKEVLLQMSIIAFEVFIVLDYYCASATVQIFFYNRSDCKGVYVENLYQFDRPGIGATLTYTGIEGLLLIFLVVLVEVCTYVCTCMCTY